MLFVVDGERQVSRGEMWRGEVRRFEQRHALPAWRDRLNGERLGGDAKTTHRPQRQPHREDGRFSNELYYQSHLFPKCPRYSLEEKQDAYRALLHSSPIPN